MAACSQEDPKDSKNTFISPEHSFDHRDFLSMELLQLHPKSLLLEVP